MSDATIQKALTILVIDDNPADAGILRRLLAKIKDEQFELFHELTPQSGKERLAESSVDCLVLDYELGGTTGAEVLKDLRKSGIDVPVVAYSGAGTETIATNAMKEGAQDYLVKGEVTAMGLRRTILNAIHKVSLKRQIHEQKEELKSFVGIVAHDLRAPICHISNFTNILKEEAPPLGYELDEIIDIQIPQIEWETWLVGFSTTQSMGVQKKHL
jgi:DNA-binding NtrC family response regulator